MGIPIKFYSWFAIPRHVMADRGGIPTEFDKHAPPAMRLYLRLCKLRRNPSLTVEISNTDLMELTGLKEKTFRRARQSLVEWGLISDGPVDSTGEIHLYEIQQPSNPAWQVPESSVIGIAMAPRLDTTVVPISRESMMSALNPLMSLKGNADA
jgi:hypothetical protein